MYMKLQKKLRKLRITQSSAVQALSCASDPELCRRIEMGKNLVLIDPSRNLYPKIIFKKIGKGGDTCVVTYASYNRWYHEYAEKIPQYLENCSYNGWFLCRLGGYPNPTGKELRYAGYPYAWKMFMIMEAFNKNFSNVLWIDAPFIPLKDPAWLFRKISQNGGLFFGPVALPFEVMFSSAKPAYDRLGKILQQRYGTNPYRRHVCGQVIGLKKNCPQTKKLIQLWYDALCSKNGTMFISSTPEETVLDALIQAAGFSEKVYYKTGLQRSLNSLAGVWPGEELSDDPFFSAQPFH